MPRIRSIKPEFWSSEQVVECSPIARLLFVGMWNFCDDGGVHPASTKRIKMEVFPGDTFDDSQITAYTTELLEADLIRQFESEGKQWWWVTGWKHQKIDKPTYKYPRPPFADSSPTTRRKVVERLPLDVDVEVDKDVDIDTDVDKKNSSEPSEKKASKQVEMTGFVFPVVGDKNNPEWTLPKSKLDEWVQTFPNLNVEAELSKAVQWCRDNPTKRKTARGITKFVGNWLTRQTDNGRSNNNGKPRSDEAGQGGGMVRVGTDWGSFDFSGPPKAKVPEGQ